MIKIGILGLGNIASKAYLPIYLEMNDRVEFYYFTRSEEKLENYKVKYNLTNTYSDLDEFFDLPLDACMIHTPTYTHAEYIDRALDLGWHVFVDKPISQYYNQVETLIEKAYKNELVLFTGFNRRYAPFNAKLQDIENKSMLFLQKTREMVKQDAAFAIYDMMIHMVDTSLFLLNEEITSSDVKAFKDHNGNLTHALIYLRTSSASCVTSINMNAGARTETVEIMAEDSYAYSENLDKITWLEDGKETIERYADWTPTLHKRGFESMIQDFVNKVESKDYEKQEFALESHYYCQQLVDALEEN